MQFLRCPDCGEVIFADASACRYCGRSLDQADIDAGVRAYQEKLREKQAVVESSSGDVGDIWQRVKTTDPAVTRDLALKKGAVSRRYAVLLIALLPLVFLTVHRDSGDVMHRLAYSISQLPEEDQTKIKESISKNEATIDSVVAELPDHRIEGAHLGRDSWRHWLYAGAASIAFLVFLIFAFPSTGATPKKLFLTGLFTGTAGILSLLAFQFAAAVTQGVWFRGASIFTVLLYIVKFIGYSYTAALDPNNGFILSCIGYTCGVGFCEEICKMLPLIRHVRRGLELDWRYACLLGLASGAGFGVSEGITYASSYYNGVEELPIYLVRFISCVALHAIWSAAAGIKLCERQQLVKVKIGSSAAFLEYIVYLLAIVAVPMTFHGLYDTLLKKQMDVIALLIAVVSFAWLAIKIERFYRLESASEVPSAPVDVVV
jgi:protease PrsW